MSAVVQSSTASEQSAAFEALHRAFGKPDGVRSGPVGQNACLIAIYKAIAPESLEGKLREINTDIEVFQARPTHRGGPNSRLLVTGKLHGADLLLKTDNFDQPSSHVEVRLYAPGAEGCAIDPVQLFMIADEIFGGADAAVKLLPAYIATHLMRLKGSEKRDFCADLSQTVTDTLRESFEEA